MILLVHVCVCLPVCRSVAILRYILKSYSRIFTKITLLFSVHKKQVVIFFIALFCSLFSCHPNAGSLFKMSSLLQLVLCDQKSVNAK